MLRESVRFSTSHEFPYTCPFQWQRPSDIILMHRYTRNWRPNTSLPYQAAQEAQALKHNTRESMICRQVRKPSLCRRCSRSRRSWLLPSRWPSTSLLGRPERQSPLTLARNRLCSERRARSMRESWVALLSFCKCFCKRNLLDSSSVCKSSGV